MDFYGFEVVVVWDVFDVFGGMVGFDGCFDYLCVEFDNGINVLCIMLICYGVGVFYDCGGLFVCFGILWVNK